MRTVQSKALFAAVVLRHELQRAEHAAGASRTRTRSIGRPFGSASPRMARNKWNRRIRLWHRGWARDPSLPWSSGCGAAPAGRAHSHSGDPRGAGHVLKVKIRARHERICRWNRTSAGTPVSGVIRSRWNGPNVDVGGGRCQARMQHLHGSGGQHDLRKVRPFSGSRALGIGTVAAHNVA